jgi:DNA primase
MAIRKLCPISREDALEGVAMLEMRADLFVVKVGLTVKFQIGFQLPPCELCYMARIPAEIVDRIVAAADIVEVVGDVVQLKKKGQNMWACCPFHQEKSPSFSVSPAKGIFKCFGCGKAGDAVKFVMETDGASYVEALRTLAKRYSIEIPETELAPDSAEAIAHSARESLFILSNWAKNFYREQLHKTEDGRIGLSYFRERQLDKATIEKFELGYSPDAWSALTDKALAEGYELKFLEASGLTIVKDEKRYDRFRARVVFPIHNVSGKVIGFGARALKRDEKGPKYLNSPESEIYHKSDVLYGMYFAKQAIRQADLCYLTEGYLDVISLAQAGIANVVASSGTSLTEGQIRLIGRYSQNVTILYDGDAAGIKASLRGMDLILEAGLNVSIVLFPEREDPDSYVRKVGEEAFRKYLADHTQDFISFKARLIAEDAKSNPAKRAEAVREIVETIVKIPDGIKRAVYFKEAAAIFGLEEQLLISEANKLTASQRQQDRKKLQEDPSGHPPFQPEELSLPEPELDRLAQLKLSEQELVRILVMHPNYRFPDGSSVLAPYLLQEVEEIEFLTPVYARIVEESRMQNNQGVALTPEFYTRHPEEQIRKEAIELQMNASRYQKSPGWKEHGVVVPDLDQDMEQAAFQAIAHLKWRNVQLMIDNVAAQVQSNTNPADIDAQLRLYQQLKSMERQLAADALGNVIAG